MNSPPEGPEIRMCLKCLAIYIVLSKEVVYNCTRPRADLPTGVTAVGQKLPQLENLSPAQRSSANLQQSSGIKHHGTSFERCLLLNVVLSRCYQVCHTRKTQQHIAKHLGVTSVRKALVRTSTPRRDWMTCSRLATTFKQKPNRQRQNAKLWTTTDDQRTANIHG